MPKTNESCSKSNMSESKLAERTIQMNRKNSNIYWPFLPPIFLLIIRTIFPIIILFCLVVTFLYGFVHFKYFSFWNFILQGIFIIYLFVFELKIYFNSGEKSIQLNWGVYYVYRLIFLHLLGASVIMSLFFFFFIRDSSRKCYEWPFNLANDIIHFITPVYIYLEFFMQDIKFAPSDMYYSAALSFFYITFMITLKLVFHSTIYIFIDFENSILISMLGMYAFVGLEMVIEFIAVFIWPLRRKGDREEKKRKEKDEDFEM